MVMPKNSIVTVNMREEAGLFLASSSDVPGLHVCGETRQKAIDSTTKAIKALFLHNKKMDVKVWLATSDDGESGHGPDNPRFIVRHAPA